MIYVYSDETTHIWLAQKKDYILVVDAGSQILAGGIQKVISDLPKDVTLAIFMTHFHADHVQSLAMLIKQSSKNVKNIVVYIHSGISCQFSGWLMENYPHVFQKEKGYLFKLIIIKDQHVHELGKNLSFQAVLHHRFITAEETKKIVITPEKESKKIVITPEPKKPEKEPKINVETLDESKKIDNPLKHYIPSTSWIIHEKGKSMKLFTGDINPPPPPITKEELQLQILNYFRQVFKEIDSSKGSKCIHVFWDYGHFDGILSKDLKYAEDLKNENFVDKNGVMIHAQFYNEHLKNEKEYRIFKIGLDNSEFEVNTVYLEPPGALESKRVGRRRSNFMKS